MLGLGEGWDLLHDTQGFNHCSSPISRHIYHAGNADEAGCRPLDTAGGAVEPAKYSLPGVVPAHLTGIHGMVGARCHSAYQHWPGESGPNAA